MVFLLPSNRCRHASIRTFEERIRSLVPAYEKALVQVGLGNKESALEDLNTAYKEGSHWIFILQSDAGLDPLRSDPRFQSLVRRSELRKTR